MPGAVVGAIVLGGGIFALLLIPFVCASLASGVVQLGDTSHLGPLAGRTFTVFFLNMAMASILGVDRILDMTRTIINVG